MSQMHECSQVINSTVNKITKTQYKVNNAMAMCNSQNESETYVFEAVLAQLCEEMEETQDGEPRTPQQNLIHVLYVHYAKDEDELVEHEVQKLVFHMLRTYTQTIAVIFQEYNFPLSSIQFSHFSLQKLHILR